MLLEPMTEFSKTAIAAIATGVLAILIVLGSFGYDVYSANKEAQLETAIAHATPMTAEITDKHVEASFRTKDYIITVPDGTIEVSDDEWQDFAIGDDVTYKAVDDTLYLDSEQ